MNHPHSPAEALPPQLPAAGGADNLRRDWQDALRLAVLFLLRIGVTTAMYIAMLTFLGFLFAITPEQWDWRRGWAILVTFPLSFLGSSFVSFQLGWDRSPLPMLISIFALPVVATLLWFLCLFGAMDLPVRLLSFISDFWMPIDFPDTGPLAWFRLVIEFATSLGLIALLHRGWELSVAAFSPKPQK